MKTVYEFEVLKEVEVEETEERQEGDKTVKVTQKVKKEVPFKFAIKQPSRAEWDDSEFYFSVKMNEAIQKGLLPRALLAKRFINDGGVLSNPAREEYAKMYEDLYKLQLEYNELEKAQKDKPQTDEKDEKTPETVKLEELRVKIVESAREIQTAETAMQSLYEHCADTYAQNQTILWLVLNLAMEDKGGYKPLFEGNTLTEKLALYDKWYDTEDKFYIMVAQKFLLFISAWYLGHATEPEHFAALN
jgi:hypothetical protein